MADCLRDLRGLPPDEVVARAEPLCQRLLRKQRGAPLGDQELPVAGGEVRRHVVVQAFEPLRPVVRDVLVLRADLRAAQRVAGDVPLPAVVAALPKAEAARILRVPAPRPATGE